MLQGTQLTSQGPGATSANLSLDAAGTAVRLINLSSRQNGTAVEDVLYHDIAAIGGSFSAEHGVGTKRIHSLLATTDETKIRAADMVKRLLDPEALLNPGKILPPARLSGG